MQVSTHTFIICTVEGISLNITVIKIDWRTVGDIVFVIGVTAVFILMPGVSLGLDLKILGVCRSTLGS